MLPGTLLSILNLEALVLAMDEEASKGAAVSVMLTQQCINFL